MISIISKTRGPVFYASSMSPCFDLRAEQGGVIQPGEIVGVSTGLMVSKAGWLDKLLSRWFVFELQLRPRKTMAISYGINLVASPVTVSSKADQDIIVFLRNDSDSPFCYSRGERLAEAAVGLSFKAAGVAFGGGK